MEAAVLGRKVGGPGGHVRSSVEVDRLGQVLVQGSLDHDLLADISKCVCYCAGRYVTPEHVAHMLARRSVPRYVRKVPEKFKFFFRE